MTTGFCLMSIREWLESSWNASCAGIGESVLSSNRGLVGISAETSGFLGRRGAGISATSGWTMLDRITSDNFLASSSLGGRLDRELAVLSVNPTEPYDEAESTEARFGSVGLWAIDVDVRGAGEIASGLFHSKSKFTVSAGLGGVCGLLRRTLGRCRSVSPSRAFSESLHSLANGSRAIGAESEAQSVYGVNGACRGDSKAEVGTRGVGISSDPSLRGARAISLLDETDRDLLRPKILVMLLPKLEPEPG